MKMRIKLYFILVCAILLISCKAKKTTEEFDVDHIKKIANLKVLDNTFKDILYIEDGGEQYVGTYNVQIQLSINMNEIDFDQNTKTLKIPKPVVSSSASMKIIDEARSSDLFFWTERINKKIIDEKREQNIEQLKKEVSENEYLINKSKNIAIELIENLVNEIYQAYGKKSEIQYVFKE